MIVCYFGSYDKNYTRNSINIYGLTLNGVEVVECNVAKPTLDLRNKFKVVIFLLITPLHIVFRNIYLLLNGLVLFFSKRFDVIYVAFPGYFELLSAYILSKITNKPIIFDAYISIYDTFINDRKLIARKSVLSRILHWMEYWLYRMPDMLITDSNTHKEFFQNEFKLPHSKTGALYIGADNRLFHPAIVEKKDIFKVIYFGGYIPLHGVQYIVKSADLLKDDSSIQLILIGGGQTYLENRKLADQLNSGNIEFIPWMEEKKLLQYVQGTDIVLGVFADTPKAQRTIQNKVYQGLACRKAVVTADSPANREIFTDKKNIFYCEPANPNSLASAIIELKNNSNLCQSIAENAYNLYVERFTPQSVGKELVNICSGVMRV